MNFQSIFSARFAFTISTAFVLALVAGFGNADQPIANAACSVMINCGPVDDTATASLTVHHLRPLADDTSGFGGVPVQPDDGETWNITATWATDTTAPLGCSCKDLVTSSVTADVSYSTSTDWSVSCTGCSPTGRIRGLSICALGDCGSSIVFDGYELVVDIDHTLAAAPCPLVPNLGFPILDRVQFQTTSVDDGDELNAPLCTLGSSVSPTSQTFTATDHGGFECGYSCSAASGTSVTITYQ